MRGCLDKDRGSDVLKDQGQLMRTKSPAWISWVMRGFAELRRVPTIVFAGIDISRPCHNRKDI